MAFVTFLVSFFIAKIGLFDGVDIFTFITTGAFGFYACASASCNIFNNLCCSSLYISWLLSSKSFNWFLKS